ncbi:MAG: DUF4198 domain-containing protein [Bacteroidetes bacterium]|nr:DUF4198 domain-containing protein [Bacteroidota bacterium]
MKILLATTYVFIHFTVCGQDFWLQPKKFKYAVGEETISRFCIGENFENDPDQIKNKIQKIDLYHLSKKIDLKSEHESKEQFKYKTTEAGTFIIAAQSEVVNKEMNPQVFNDYLEKESQDDIIAVRSKTNDLGKSIKEEKNYFTKLIFAIGNKPDDSFKKKVGSRLEIVPLQNPTLLKSGDYLQCLILLNGKPSPHQLVRIWNKIGNASILQNAYTENDGTIKFPLSSKGSWMITTLKMIPSENKNADWQSFKSSLTFGIE